MHTSFLSLVTIVIVALLLWLRSIRCVCGVVCLCVCVWSGSVSSLFSTLCSIPGHREWAQIVLYSCRVFFWKMCCDKEFVLWFRQFGLFFADVSVHFVLLWCLTCRCNQPGELRGFCAGGQRKCLCMSVPLSVRVNELIPLIRIKTAYQGCHGYRIKRKIDEWLASSFASVMFFAF